MFETSFKNLFSCLVIYIKKMLQDLFQTKEHHSLNVTKTLDR